MAELCHTGHFGAELNAYKLPSSRGNLKGLEKLHT